ncbi:MAG: hypothetical protein IK016_04370 [Lachnospiraceae bacterium]|nr:hypothetical protein [Lachnospiraceae bacterium]
MFGKMKRLVAQGMAALMMPVLLAACGGGREEAVVYVTGVGAEWQAAVTTDKEAGPRVMLSGNGKTVTGSMDLFLRGEYDALQIMRTDDAEDAASVVSLGFSLEKTPGEDGSLNVSGSLKMVPDASYLFDIPYTEDEDVEAFDDEGTETNAEENTAEPVEGVTEEPQDTEEDTEEEAAMPERISLTAEEGAALLEEMMEALISGTEAGASLQTENTGNLTWRYGAAKATESGSGVSVLNFCASAEAEGVLLYLNADAVVRGTKDATQELEQVRQDLTGWMKSLAFGSAEGDFTGYNDYLKLSFAGKTLFAPGTDYLRASGAELSASCGESFLDVSYEGIVGTEGRESFVYASLKSKNALTEEELADTENLQGETQKAKNLDWTVSVTVEEDGSRRLLAKTEAEGQPLYFLAEADGIGENKEEACDNVMNIAMGWLAALELK